MSTMIEATAQNRLPQWMYDQIVTDKTRKAVWCYCGAHAISYCNGLQFVCFSGHAGVPMKQLQPRPEDQLFLNRQAARARTLAAKSTQH